MHALQEVIAKQRQFLRTGKTKEVGFRRDSLEKLRRAIQKYEAELMQALALDLNKSEVEAYSTEVGFVLAEITHTLKHLRRWMKPEKVKTPLTHIGSKSYIYREPYGVVLNIAPWNYPINLSLTILVNAMAAGNTMVIKPSELAPHSSSVIAKLIAEAFPPDYIYVAEGGVEVSTALLAEQFDYIIYTGGGAVGKIVMEAAAKYLTPLTLELGGKSPCIVHEDADMKLAAKRIAWGKFINAGQTCIAPDYILVHTSMKERLISELKSYIEQFYGSDMGQMTQLPTIINDRHFDRITALLAGAHIAYGGVTDRERRYIAPTLLDGVHWDHPVMQEEIFGPLLPLLTYEHLDDAIAQINAQAKPLSLYVFTESKAVRKEVLDRVSFGGGCINDTLYHMANPNLPFGGVGGSGMGAYHGKAGFDLFSHKKSVLTQTTRFDLPFRYLNYKHGLKVLKMFMK